MYITTRTGAAVPARVPAPPAEFFPLNHLTIGAQAPALTLRDGPATCDCFSLRGPREKSRSRTRIESLLAVRARRPPASNRRSPKDPTSQSLTDRVERRSAVRADRPPESNRCSLQDSTNASISCAVIPTCYTGPSYRRSALRRGCRVSTASIVAAIRSANSTCRDFRDARSDVQTVMLPCWRAGL